MIYVIMFLVVAAFGLMGQNSVKTEEIEYKDGDTVLKGFLAYDSSQQGQRPGVVVVHEWWGLNDYARSRARQLAQMGYAAFAVDMYGNGMVARDAGEAAKLAGQIYQDRHLMRKRVAAGVEVLKSQTVTDPDKLAAIGFCFGGSTVLELARSGADLKGFVSFHGGLSTPQPAGSGAIKGAVLVLHGADDPHVKTSDVLAFQEEMRKAGADWQMNIYGNAVHSFTNPAAGNDNSRGSAYNKKAAERSWKAMQLFFTEIFE
jgi:dienelactone hydrolase